MKIINRNNFIPVVCVVYTVLSVGKIVLEAIAQQRFGDYQGNLLTILLFSFLGTWIISQHYRLAQLPLLIVALLQYGVLTGVVMMFTWGTGFSPICTRMPTGICSGRSRSPILSQRKRTMWRCTWRSGKQTVC